MGKIKIKKKRWEMAPAVRVGRLLRREEAVKIRKVEAKVS